MLTKLGRPSRPVLTRVRVKLCSAHCVLCQGEHEHTDVLDAERIDERHVRITNRDDVWFGAVLSESDYVFEE